MALYVLGPIHGMGLLAPAQCRPPARQLKPCSPPESTGEPELDMVALRRLELRCAARHDRNRPPNGWLTRATRTQAAHHARMVAYVLALAARHGIDLHDAMALFGDDINLSGTLVTPQAWMKRRCAPYQPCNLLMPCVAERVRHAAQKLLHDESAIWPFAVVGGVRWILPGDVAGWQPPRHASAIVVIVAPRRCREDAAANVAVRRDEALGHDAAFDTHSRLEAVVVCGAGSVRLVALIGVERRIGGT